MKNTFFVILLLALGFACTPETTCIEAPEIKEAARVTVKIDRLEQKLFGLKSVQEVEHFISSHPVLSDEFLGRQQYPSDSILALELYKRINNPFVDTLYTETLNAFGELKDLTREFEDAFSRIKYYYPTFKAPQIKTMITGFGSSEMYVGEDQVIIGLEYYLGQDAKYHPPGVPQYILPRYDKSYIVPAVMLLYASQYLTEDRSDHTMLADMMYYGKKYYFAKQMMPCAPDSLIVWYNGVQIKDVEENKDAIWFHFLNNELLYESNHFVKQKYMDERPNVAEIGEKCPGRVGSWVGWDIIRVYMNNNPDVSLQQLMSNPDAKDILTKSKYKVF